MNLLKSLCGFSDFYQAHLDDFHFLVERLAGSQYGSVNTAQAAPCDTKPGGSENAIMLQ